MHVLIVEDSPSMRAFISGALESVFDTQITEAGNGFEALKALAGGRFDAIITDINMPEINGLELIRYVRGHPVYRQTPVIIISTEVAQEDRRRGMNAGASAYINKPFRPDELQEVIGELLSGKGA